MDNYLNYSVAEKKDPRYAAEVRTHGHGGFSVFIRLVFRKLFRKFVS